MSAVGPHVERVEMRKAHVHAHLAEPLPWTARKVLSVDKRFRTLVRPFRFPLGPALWDES